MHHTQWYHPLIETRHHGLSQVTHMKQSGFKAENGYNPESNTTVSKKHISDQKTMIYHLNQH